MSDTISNNISTPVMIYGRNPSGVLQAVTTDGSGNLNITGAGGGGSGTVTNIATTAPITGGPITTTGTIACATCVTSAASITSNVIPKGSGGAQGLANSSITDNGTTVSTSELVNFAGVAAASTVPFLLNGTIFTGGTTATTLPYAYLNFGSAPAWSTNGTLLGINAPSGFTGSIFDYHVNGGASLFSMSGAGQVSVSQTLVVGSTVSGSKFNTGTNCSSAASPAVCAAASSGSVAIAAGTNPTLQINTTAVSANSQIQLTMDESLGTKLSVTCQTAVNPTALFVTARTAATNFTIQAIGVFSTNPICVSYTILN